MITKFLGKVFSGRLFKQHGVKIVPFSAHGIARERISPCALKTTQLLQEHGHTAFIVGGAVRDAILGRAPKDFDVATSATPEQVRELFRRSRIIGRRFKIVHVMCGRETVEVSTYRAGAIGNESNDQQIADEHGRLLRDNVFGTQEQDALRRDFTINALFYDPTTQQVWDFHDGVEDLKKKRLRMIGDPEQRYREDPVRMLRAVRFSASRGLEIDQATREPIKAVTPLLAHVPAARLFDEMLKLLMSGHAYECVMALRQEGLHHGLLPMLDVILEQPMGERFVLMSLRNTDARINSDKSVSPSFLFASLLWHEVLATWKKLEGKGMQEIPALYEAMDEVAQSQAAMLAIPRRFSNDMKEIWVMQPRFLQRKGRRPYRLLENPRFRAAYDFLLLRCASGEVDPEVGEWWTRFQHADENERSALLAEQGAEPLRRKRRRKRRAPSSDAALPIDSAPSGL
jgi:poly(A) polymerase